MSKGREQKRALPKWICGSEFEPRPTNISGAPRVELVRDKETGTQFLARYIAEQKIFERCSDCKRFGADSVEVKIIEIF